MGIQILVGKRAITINWSYGGVQVLAACNEERISELLGRGLGRTGGCLSMIVEPQILFPCWRSGFSVLGGGRWDEGAQRFLVLSEMWWYHLVTHSPRYLIYLYFWGPVILPIFNTFTILLLQYRCYNTPIEQECPYLHHHLLCSFTSYSSNFVTDTLTEITPFITCALQLQVYHIITSTTTYHTYTS